MKIITNNHYRHILYFHELEPSEQDELKDSYDSVEESTFFRYRGQVYDLNNFMRSTDNRFGDWQGYHSDSFFSAVLVKYDVSCEAVKVGLALS
jgi:hypothetical protein